jgi:large subunit ribosomal protein L14
MVQSHSKLKIGDNSGVKSVKCIKVLGGNVGFYGKIVVVSVKKISVRSKSKSSQKTKSRLNKGDVVKGLIVSCKKPISRNDGRKVLFSSNIVVLLTDFFKSKKLIGTRVLVPIAKEYRNKKMMKLLSVSSVFL